MHLESASFASEKTCDWPTRYSNTHVSTNLASSSYTSTTPTTKGHGHLALTMDRKGWSRHSPLLSDLQSNPKTTSARPMRSIHPLVGTRTPLSNSKTISSPLERTSVDRDNRLSNKDSQLIESRNRARQAYQTTTDQISTHQ